MQPVQQRYESLQVARIVGAVLVLTYHFGAVELKYGDDRLITPLLSYAEGVIDLFFVVSGFLMGTLYRKTPASLAAVGDFVVRRAFRIYPSYWMISLLVIALWLGSGQRIFSHLVGSDPHILSSLLLVPSTSRPMLQVAWTLLHEVYFYAGFAVLLALKESWRAIGLCVWAALAVVGYGLLPQPAAHPGLSLLVSPYTLEFITGVAMGWCAPLMRRNAPRLALAAAALLWVSGMVLTGFDPARKALWPDAARIALDGTTALLFAYGLIAADLKGLWTCPPPLAAAGDWSYALYLVHTVIIAAVCVVWRKISGPGLIDNALIYAICLGLSLVISAQIWTRLERPACRSASKVVRWIGGRLLVAGQIATPLVVRLTRSAVRA
jgi:peptidoglycan/LPS O-acetylase OafA/YrhL